MDVLSVHTELGAKGVVRLLHQHDLVSFLLSKNTDSLVLPQERKLL